jgi:hypothetical protein
MNLEELKKLCDEATPGPWSPVIGFCADGYSTLLPRADEEEPMTGHDKRFIAAAREAMPKLLELWEAVKEFDDSRGGKLSRLRRALADLDRP